jgi:hypothetical protein
MIGQYRVVKPHAPESDEPLIVAAGERMRFERRTTQWAGWLWCTVPDGPSGWVPESWIEIEGDFCVMARDYDGTELTVAPDQILTGILIESEWLMADGPDGVRGWVPLGNVEAV